MLIPLLLLLPGAYLIYQAIKEKTGSGCLTTIIVGFLVLVVVLSWFL